MKKFMNSYQLKVLTLACIASLCFTSCSQEEGEQSNDFGSIGGGGGGTSTPSASDGTPLYFSVTTQYERGDGASDDEPILYHGTCEIDPANLAANNIPCTISIPEGVLHYSNTTIKIGTNNTALCPRIEFDPYYRKLSDSATFRPPRSTTDIDCTPDGDVPIGCYDGAALDIVGSDFPKYTGKWFPTTETASADFKIEAAYTKATVGNTHVCSNLPLAARGSDIAGIYKSGTFQDYVVACVDPWQGTVFKITVTIQDYDVDNVPTDAGNDEFYDWN